MGQAAYFAHEVAKLREELAAALSGGSSALVVTDFETGWYEAGGPSGPLTMRREGDMIFLSGYLANDTLTLTSGNAVQVATIPAEWGDAAYQLAVAQPDANPPYAPIGLIGPAPTGLFFTALKNFAADPCVLQIQTQWPAG